MNKISTDKKYYLLDEDNDLVKVTPQGITDYSAYFEDEDGNTYGDNIEVIGEEVYKDDSDNIIFSEDALYTLYDSLDYLLHPVDHNADCLPAFPSTDKDKSILESYGEKYIITPIPIGNGRVYLSNLRKGQSVVFGDGKRYIYILTEKETKQ